MQQIIDWIKGSKFAKAFAVLVVALGVLIATPWGRSLYNSVRQWAGNVGVQLPAEPMPPPEPQASPAPKRPLQMGDVGQNVKALQLALQAVGCEVAADGIFGPETAKAVKECGGKVDERLIAP